MRRTRFSPIALGLATVLLAALTIMDAAADYKYDYYDYNEMVAVLEDLETQSASKTPDVFSLQVIGYSFLANPIYAVKFSDDPGTEDDAEPDVLIDSGIHANEWLGTEATIRYIEYLFDAYYDDLHPDHAEVVGLVEDFEIWFIPMINPDGRIRDDQSGGDPTSFWTDTTYHADDYVGWRMNVQNVDCAAKPEGTNIGIDINRTFTYKFWESSDCLSTIYNGGVAFAAPESKVVKQFVHNHMISLIFHHHSNAQYMVSVSGLTGLGDYLTYESAAIYNNDPTLPSALMKIGTFETTTTTTGPAAAAMASGAVSGYASEAPFVEPLAYQTDGYVAAAGVCGGSRFTGQYYNWAWTEINCILAPDNHSRRTIQMIMYEMAYDDGATIDAYGHTSEGKIGQFEPGDGSNGFHPSSGEANQWIIDKSREMNKYFIEQSRYPFSPRNYEDMSPRPEAPVMDLAIVGAKVSEVGSGLPGCFGYNDYGRDTLASGTKRITWNVQNNGTGTRTINSSITVCNTTDDPGCLSPTSATLTRTDVAPEGIETLTYDYNFHDAGCCKDYSVTLTTGEANAYNNDLKRFVFTVTSATDDDCDGIADGDDNCSSKANGPVVGTCTAGKIGEPCMSNEWCGTAGVCSMLEQDTDSDGPGDACDNCPSVANSAQEDTMPPGGNGCGNACECEGNFDGDVDCDGTDAAVFKTDFGRNAVTSPCTAVDPCNGDFSCNGNVDGTDAARFKSDFGRSGFTNPCPSCVNDPWCGY
jgi:hypothetical protein